MGDSKRLWKEPGLSNRAKLVLFWKGGKENEQETEKKGGPHTFLTTEKDSPSKERGALRV